MKSIKTSLPITGYWDTRQGGRAENQDACGFIDTPLGFIAVVCDGMGGGPSGQLAATVAVQKIVEFVMNAPEDASRKDVMKDAIEYAHETILKMGTDNPSLRGMGTTVASVLINKYSAIISHVGDSRVYQFRWGRKKFRTQDHSMVADLVRNGTLTEEQARLSSQSNLITKALGGQLSNIAEVSEVSYESGDRFLLCTDGIWGMMPERDLIRRTAKTPSLSGAVDGTILEVDELGRRDGNTHDNMTIVMIETKQDSIIKEKMNKKTLRIILGLAAICIISFIANIILIGKLSAPNPAEQQVETLMEQSQEKDKKIGELQQEVNKLKTDMANQTQETAKAKLEVAKEQEEAAKRARAQAEEQAKEAQAAAEKATAAAKQAQAANDILKRVQGIIGTISSARDTKEGNNRDRLRNSAIADLKSLSQKDPKHKAIYSEVSEKLNNKIAHSNSKEAKNHYNILIQKLKTIK